MKITPTLDKRFRPAVVEIDAFNSRVAYEGGKPFGIALERNDGYVYRRDMQILKDDDVENFRIVERIVKSLVWAVGGFALYIAGDPWLCHELEKAYAEGGLREFDAEFMGRVYERPFEVIQCGLNELPEAKECSNSVGRHLNGCRIGFDAGGSDRKVSASIDGEVVYSEEVVWFPKINEDPDYHYQGILDSMMRAAEKMPTVDAIGVSSAGIYVNNRIMVASLFLKVPNELFDSKVKNMYLDCARALSEKYGKQIPIEVANDGDVTALAGAMDLNDNQVLGIAMGTSEAAGYIDENGNLRGWLSELAFVPVDFNPDSMVDEWSGDYGCGVKYFSQDGVIKLADYAGIDLSAGQSPAEKLKIVQKLAESGDERALTVFRDTGICLGYSLAYYATIYDIKHVLILGRVTSGVGGTLILEQANRVLAEEFPSLKLNLQLPDESNRRVGQSIAAASLPEVK